MTVHVSSANARRQLVTVLRQRHAAYATELAEALGVTPRTVYRWVQRLRADGYNIPGSRGAGGGYMLRGER